MEIYEDVLARASALEAQGFLIEREIKQEESYIQDDFSIRLVEELGKSRNVIQIVHPEINDEKEFDELCMKFQKEYEQILNEDDPRKALECIGRLAYSLFRNLPFWLGTCSITEWLIGALVTYKNIELDYQPAKTSLHLDWEAFFTPDIEEYAKWFANTLSPKLGKNDMPSLSTVSLFALPSSFGQKALEDKEALLPNHSKCASRINRLGPN